MAGFGGIPLGNIGARAGANFDPYLRMRRMQMQDDHFTRAAEAARMERMEGQEFDMLRFQEQQRQAELDRAQQQREFTGRMEIERGGLGLKEKGLGLQERDMLQRGSLTKRGQDLTDLGRREALHYQKGRDESGDAFRERETTLKETTAKTKAQYEKEDRDTAKGDKQSVLEGSTWVESEAVPYLMGEFQRRADKTLNEDGTTGRPLTSKEHDLIVSSAKSWAQRKYGDNPMALKAALESIDKTEAKMGEERKVQISETMHELQVKIANGQLDQQEGEKLLQNNKIEMSNILLKDAEKTMDLTPEEMKEAITSVQEGRPMDAAVQKRIRNNPKVREWFDWQKKDIYEAAEFASRQASSKLDQQSKRQGIEVVAKQTGITGKGSGATGRLDRSRMPSIPPGQEDTEENAIKALKRKSEDGTLGEVGEVKSNIYDRLEKLKGETDPDAKSRVENLNRLVKMLGDYKDEDDLPGNMDPGWWGAWGLGASGLRRLWGELGIGEEGDLRDLLAGQGLE